MRGKFFELSEKMMRLHLLRRIQMQKAAPEGLHFGQFPLLEYIVENGPCTQREMAEKTGVTPASVAISTKRLARVGLIEKQAAKEDLRCNKVFATERGRTLMESCRGEFDACDTKMFSGVREEDLETFGAVLDKLIENLSEGFADASMPALCACIAREKNSVKEGEG